MLAAEQGELGVQRRVALELHWLCRQMPFGVKPVIPAHVRRRVHCAGHG